MPSKAEIEAKLTPAGGYLKKDLLAWGVPWPPPKGWKQRLIYDHAKANGLPEPTFTEDNSEYKKYYNYQYRC